MDHRLESIDRLALLDDPSFFALRGPSDRAAPGGRGHLFFFFRTPASGDRSGAAGGASRNAATSGSGRCRLRSQAAVRPPAREEAAANGTALPPPAERLSSAPSGPAPSGSRPALRDPAAAVDCRAAAKKRSSMQRRRAGGRHRAAAPARGSVAAVSRPETARLDGRRRRPPGPAAPGPHGPSVRATTRAIGVRVTRARWRPVRQPEIDRQPPLQILHREAAVRRLDDQRGCAAGQVRRWCTCSRLLRPTLPVGRKDHPGSPGRTAAPACRPTASTASAAAGDAAAARSSTVKDGRQNCRIATLANTCPPGLPGEVKHSAFVGRPGNGHPPLGSGGGRHTPARLEN